jgi:hypothetical protein
MLAFFICTGCSILYREGGTKTLAVAPDEYELREKGHVLRNGERIDSISYDIYVRQLGTPKQPAKVVYADNVTLRWSGLSRQKSMIFKVHLPHTTQRLERKEAVGRL